MHNFVIIFTNLQQPKLVLGTRPQTSAEVAMSKTSGKSPIVYMFEKRKVGYFLASSRQLTQSKQVYAKVHG